MWTGTGIIEDEYGQKIETKEMMEIIEAQKGEKPHDEYSGYGMPVPVVVEGAAYDYWLDVDFS